MMSEPTISFKGNKRFRVDRGNSHYNSKKAKKETIIPALSVYKQETIYPDTATTTTTTLGDKYKNMKRFVSDIDGKDFINILKTSYKGFVVDEQKVFDESFHSDFKRALKGLESSGMYVHDITQPLGLNTKLAKTYVSRCLVGIPGITYKYLGLRMFSIPWDEGETGATVDSVMIGKMNQILSKRTKVLLTDGNNLNTTTSNDATRKVGSCNYNLTLINRLSSYCQHIH